MTKPVWQPLISVIPVSREELEPYLSNPMLVLTNPPTFPAFRSLVRDNEICMGVLGIADSNRAKVDAIHALISELDMGGPCHD